SRSTFQTSVSVRRVVPSLAQRFGLGLANPWGTLGVLLIVAIGVAAITTMGNILTIFGYGLAGFVLLRVIPRSPVRWTIFALVLAAGLFLTFVSPGGPILFLGTMPSMGFPIAPFGLIAATAVLLLALWVGDIALRHVEDLYRVGALVALGVYFFAYVEAIVFVQQRLGYI
ncbi:MAG: hypothetical protein M3Z66_22400, partial [Chloroflexota bacterium]|nr:hypothetical protein [Chloroflexota bacterium]